MTTDDPKPAVTIPKDALDRPLPKRFYTAASVGLHDGQPAILLDGRVARTPGKRPLAMPSAALAEAVAAEWAAQVSTIDPATMPLTRIVNTVLDGVVQRADQVRAEVVKYAGSDLVCYRADFPAELVARQSAAWDPVIEWAHAKLGVRFYLAEGVMPVTQLPGTLAKVAEYVAPLDVYRLAAVHIMMTLTGSALIAIATADGDLTAEEAWSAAHVDEDFQISQWGEDEEAMERRARRKVEFDAAVFVAGLG